MAWTPANEDGGAARGRRFGFRLSPFVRCDLLEVRGVQMRNRHMVAMVSIVCDDVMGEWTASLVTCEREDLARAAEDEGDDGA